MPATNAERQAKHRAKSKAARAGAPTYYSVESDQFEPITQERLDRFWASEQAYGQLRMAIRALLDASHSMATAETPVWSVANLIRERVTELKNGSTAGAGLAKPD